MYISNKYCSFKLPFHQKIAMAAENSALPSQEQIALKNIQSHNITVFTVFFIK